VSATQRHLYLASRSPRRREILTQMGVRFEMLLLREGAARAIDIDETPHAGEPPADYVVRVARTKADAGWTRVLQRGLYRMPVLSADTTVAAGVTILGKPVDRDDAVTMLARLSGTEHHVHTAVAMALDGRIEHRLSTTAVRFATLSMDTIRRYVASGEPMDKAGAYGIQGRAALFVEHIAGSHSGVMGLPIFETGALLAQFGVQLG
jgi:septum formation protein